MRGVVKSTAHHLIVLLIFLGFMMITAAAAQAGPGLFVPAAGPLEISEPSGRPADPTEMREQRVQFNRSGIGEPEALAGAESILLNLFDVTLTAVRDRTEHRNASRFSWFGKIPGDPFGSVILVLHDGSITGNVVYSRRMFKIRPVSGDLYRIVEIDQSAFPNDSEPRVPPVTPQRQAQDIQYVVPMDTGDTIDVMVVYTSDAVAAMLPGDVTDLEAVIQTAIDETNDSYLNSGITQRLRLVHTEQVAYTQPDPATDPDPIGTALDDLTYTGGSYSEMDNVQTLRDTYKADLVSLWVSYPTNVGCGVAWLAVLIGASAANYGYSVINLPCATGYYSFGHELGHNMGARHDWATDSGITPYPYSHGYFNAAESWRTIMAYNNASCAGGSCWRIQYWSNPDVLYPPLMSPMGIAEGQPNAADNRKTLNNTAYTVANFRAGGDSSPPAAPTGLSASPATWTNVNTFSVDWTNPADPSGIAGAWYTVGAVPTTDTDGTYTTGKPFNVAATGQGGQNIYVWLQDGAGNKSHLNRDYTTLYYETAAPTDGTLTATKGNASVSLSWTAASDTGGSGLKSSNRYIVRRNTGGYPNTTCSNGTQVYLGNGTSATDSGLANGTTYYYRVCAYDSAGNVSQGATASTTLTVNIQVNSSPPGRFVEVDTVSYLAPRFETWITASSHSLNVASPQAGVAGTQYVFSSWSDGGAQSHSVAPVVDTLYTANFTTQYSLTTSVTGAHGSIQPASGLWYNSGSLAQLTAIPDSGYVVNTWSGDCAGTDVATTLTMNGVKTCSVSFSSCAGDPAKIAGGITYADIYTAYNSAVEGDTIQLIATTFNESPAFNRSVSITLRGGYGCGYTGPSSVSIISVDPGTVTVSRGAVTMDGVVIR